MSRTLGGTPSPFFTPTAIKDYLGYVGQHHKDDTIPSVDIKSVFIVDDVYINPAKDICRLKGNVTDFRYRGDLSKFFHTLNQKDYLSAPYFTYDMKDMPKLTDPKNNATLSPDQYTEIPYTIDVVQTDSEGSGEATSNPKTYSNFDDFFDDFLQANYDFSRGYAERYFKYQYKLDLARLKEIASQTSCSYKDLSETCRTWNYYDQLVFSYGTLYQPKNINWNEVFDFWNKHKAECCTNANPYCNPLCKEAQQIGARIYSYGIMFYVLPLQGGEIRAFMMSRSISDFKKEFNVSTEWFLMYSAINSDGKLSANFNYYDKKYIACNKKQLAYDIVNNIYTAYTGLLIRGGPIKNYSTSATLSRYTLYGFAGEDFDLFYKGFGANAVKVKAVEIDVNYDVPYKPVYIDKKFDANNQGIYRGGGYHSFRELDEPLVMIQGELSVYGNKVTYDYLNYHVKKGKIEPIDDSIRKGFKTFYSPYEITFTYTQLPFLQEDTKFTKPIIDTKNNFDPYATIFPCTQYFIADASASDSDCTIFLNSVPFSYTIGSSTYNTTVFNDLNRVVGSKYRMGIYQGESTDAIVYDLNGEVQGTYTISGEQGYVIEPIYSTNEYKLKGAEGFLDNYLRGIK